MAYNSIDTSFRFTGLASGLDTESIIKNLMKVERMSVEKVEKQKQISEWKQEQYREITNSLKDFKSKYFDYLNPQNNMLSANTFKQFSAVSSDNTIVRVEGTYQAMESNHTVKVNNLATASSIKSTSSITKSVKGTNSADFALASGKSFYLNIDGNSHTIEIDAGITDISSLQSAIDETIGSNKVAVTDAGGGVLSFNPAADSGIHKISLSSGSDSVLADLGFDENSIYSNRLSLDMSLESISGVMKDSFAFTGDNLSLTINGESFTFDKSSKLSDMLNEINSNSNTGVTAKYNELTDEFEFYSDDTGKGHNIKLGYDSGGFFNAVNLSSTTGTSSISDLGVLDFSGGNEKYLDLVIDGEKQQIVLDSNYSGDADYSNLLNDLEGKIELAYGLGAGSISAALGGDNKLNIEAVTGADSLVIAETSADSALSVLGLEANYLEGEDSEVLIDGEKVVRSDNTFTIEGIKYTALKESSEEQTISLELDTDGIYDKIKDFVESYNELITDLNGKINEDYDREYQPLTDEQKEAMSEDDIEKWEEKAQTGLLKNDSLLKKLLSNMRTALYDSVDSISTSLYEIGITTGSYKENGQLHIDETKLKTAIDNNPDSIMNLFTTPPTNSTINIRTLTSDERNERYKEVGLAYRISDILDDNISTYRDNNGRKGFLIEKAGWEGDASQYKNYLYKQIEDYEEEIDELYEKLADKEESYYSQFTALEKAMSRLQSQSSYITSMLGGSGG